MIVKRRERSDRAPSSGGSERSERDTSANGGSGATVRHHRQGASEAMRNIGSEGAKRPKQSEQSERRYTHIIRQRERSDRAPLSAGSERSERENPTYYGSRQDLCFTVVRERRASEREEPQSLHDATETHARKQRTEQTCGTMPQKQAQKRQEQAVTRTPQKQGAGACMRAGGSGRARKVSAWENISREQQHHSRDAPIKYNENYKTASEAQRMSYNTSLC